MSLINKMLQDLDARGTPASQSFPSNVMPVAPERRTPSLRLAGLGAGAALALAACASLAWFGWHHWHAARPGSSAAVPAALKPPTARSPSAQGLNGTIVPAPAASNAPPARIAPPGAVEPQAAAPASAPVPLPAPVRQDAGAAKAPPAPHAEHKRHADDEAKPAAHYEAAARAGAKHAHGDAREQASHAAGIELATRKKRMARLARMAPPQAHADAEKAADKAGVKGKVEGKVAAEGLQEPVAQRAESAYRHALASLQDGRMLEAIAALQQVLRADPGHDAARQTLVGLLVESGRGDDAIRELQLGLARDPRQPALAMLLARLQIEHGGSGIETLQRTLPYAGNGTLESAEYRAFLAGALQRQQRQREAVGQYQQALRTAPGNGVWWMGLGISLQADKRNAEALDAFQRARASGSLNAELQGFVERRIQQLGR